MSRPKKEEYVPRSVSEGKPSPVCISVEKFLEMDEKIKRYEKALKDIDAILDNNLHTPAYEKISDLVLHALCDKSL
jgi:hypothetical protein